MWIKILGSTVLAALAYKAGGSPRPFRTWMRDWIIPGIVIAIMIFVLKIKAPWWTYLLSYPLMGGALTTYWDDSKNSTKNVIARIINWMYPKDNFYLHGFIIGLGLLPIVIWGNLGLIYFLIRAIVLGLTMGSLNYFVHKFHIPFSDYIEELFRGGIIILTLPILLIGG